MPKKDPLVGRRIVAVRPMTVEMARRHGWWTRTTVLELDDGTLLYASADDEGSGPGALFGVSQDGWSFAYPVLRLGQ